MPKMVYDLPTVGPQVQQVSPVSAPRVSTDAGKGFREAGKLLTGAGTLALQIQDDIDSAQAKNADNRLTEFIRNELTNPELGYMNLSGKAAIDGREKTVDVLGEQMRTIEKDLGTDLQRSMFRRAANARLGEAYTRIDVHAAKQARVYHLGETQARAKAAQEKAILLNVRGDIPGYEREKALYMKEVENALVLSGVPERSDQYEAAEKSAMSGLTVGVTEQLLTETNPHFAEKWFTENISDVLTNARPSLQRRIKTAVDLFDGRNFGEGIWQAAIHPEPHAEGLESEGEDLAPYMDPSGRMNINWIPNMESFFDQIDKWGGNPDKKRHAKAALQSRIAEWNAEIASRQKQSASTLMLEFRRDTGLKNYDDLVAQTEMEKNLTHESKLQTKGWLDRAYGIEDPKKVIQAIEEADDEKDFQVAFNKLRIGLASGEINPKEHKLELWAAMAPSRFGEKRAASVVQMLATARIAGITAAQKSKVVRENMARKRANKVRGVNWKRGVSKGEIDPDAVGPELLLHLGEEYVDAVKFSDDFKHGGAATISTWRKLESTLRTMRNSRQYADVIPDFGSISESLIDPDTEAEIDVQNAFLTYINKHQAAAMKMGKKPLDDEILIKQALEELPLTPGGYFQVPFPLGVLTTIAAPGEAVFPYGRFGFGTPGGKTRRFLLSTTEAPTEKELPSRAQDMLLADQYQENTGRVPRTEELPVIREYMTLREAGGLPSMFPSKELISALMRERAKE